MTRGQLDLLFGIGLVAVFAAALISAQGFRAQARLFPIVIAIAGLALALLQVVLELRRRQAVAREPVAVVAPPTAVVESPEASPISAEERRRRTALILGWIFAFVIVVRALGFPIAVPLMTLAYFRFGAQESWRTSVIFAALSGIVFYALFVQLIRIPFDDGLLFEFLAG